ncbi:MAG: hypothetical protein RI932_392 [Pseudomonadota bacterium]|jgi:hypothetical protein
MTVRFINNLVAFSVVSLLTVGQAFAGPSRSVASNEKGRTLVAQVEDEQDEPAPESKARRKQKQANRTTGASTNENYWYARIQQLPLLGLAAVSDNGVLDVELMKVVNRNFHVGPTAVYHFGKQNDTKMQSFNLGVRADLILSEMGNLTDIYLSTALMFGRFESNTTKYTGETRELQCEFSAKGNHRVGAIAAGKIWTLSDSLHVTTGLGIVKTKTTGAIDKSEKGTCERSITESDGTTLPWFDFGVGFRL